MIIGNTEFWRVLYIIAAALGQTLFVLLYLTWPWWKEFLGRALFFKAVVFCILLDVAVAARLTDWPYEEDTIVVLYGLTAAGIWAQLFAFMLVRFSSESDGVSGNGGGRS